MKGKNLIISIALLLLLSGNLFQYVISKKQNKQLINAIEKMKQDSEQKISTCEFNSYELKNDIQTCLQNDGLRIDPETKVYDMETHEADKLKNLLTHKTLLIRISQANCQVCIDALLSLFNKVKSGHILLLADYTNSRFLKKIKENHQITYPCYKIEKPFAIPVEDLCVPYLFIMDEKMEVNCLYIPHKEMPEEIEKCLEIINKRISSL